RPAQVPLGGDQLGAAELADLLVAVAFGPLAAAARQAQAGVGADGGGGGDGDEAHHLDAARDHHVLGAGGDGLGGEVDGLLGGAALPVHGGAGHGLGQPGG